jgi:site-specific DNA-methyltransferase (adenine-specific)
MENKEMIILLNDDCMNVMAQYPDKYFQLAICDPPYGINQSQQMAKKSNKKYGKSAAFNGEYKYSEWDSCCPNQLYFTELYRISKNQILWGANYYPQFIFSSMGWVVWDKVMSEGNGYSDAELAFTSFNTHLRIFKFMWNGMLQQNMKDKETRIHPTQKPVALYKWLLKNYAKPTDKIIDTHLGSGSSAIACYDFGVTEFIGTEIDKEYFDAAVKRFENHKLQQTINFDK